MAVLRQEARCRAASRRCGERGATVRAVDPDLAAVGLGDAEQHLGDLRAAGADQAEEAQDLARAQIEAHVLDEDRPRRGSRTLSTGSPISAASFGKKRAGLGADHVTHGLLGREVRGRARDDPLARSAGS